MSLRIIKFLITTLTNSHKIICFKTLLYYEDLLGNCDSTVVDNNIRLNLYSAIFWYFSWHVLIKFNGIAIRLIHVLDQRPSRFYLLTKLLKLAVKRKRLSSAFNCRMRKTSTISLSIEFYYKIQENIVLFNIYLK